MTASDDEAGLRAVRALEIDLIRSWVPPGARVLEIGGGNGFQASLMASWGYQVTSIDIAGSDYENGGYFPVQIYDGSTIPYPDSTFDFVFSCNVLEHVAQRDKLLAEIRRVLKARGRAAHLLPSSSWRLWSALGHYLRLYKRAVQLMMGGLRKTAASRQAVRQEQVRLPQLHLYEYLILRPHGEYRSAVAELWHYRSASWRRMLERAGDETVWEGSNGLFYTGFWLWPALSLTARRRLARVLGPAGHLFVTRPASRQNFTQD